MHSRRLFLQTSAAAASTILAASRGLAAGALKDRSRPIDAIVFDQRLGACRDFADEAVRHGAEALGIRGDISELWYTDLRARLQANPTIVAGLTLEPAAYHLRAFARDIAYQEIFRGDHVLDGRQVRHRVSAPTSLETTAERLPETANGWVRAVTRLMSEIDADSKLRDRTTVGAHVHTYSDDEHRLVSWVIAPIYS
ncbi:hypothetical protein [Candidatus Rariloculus sp.]|uniref:hypothetical protein n=1 Tax=Candidatus Rariloculus sp. TaxID=3101265 RepID=UPI003D11A692